MGKEAIKKTDESYNTYTFLIILGVVLILSFLVVIFLPRGEPITAENADILLYAGVVFFIAILVIFLLRGGKIKMNKYEPSSPTAHKIHMIRNYSLMAFVLIIGVSGLLTAHYIFGSIMIVVSIIGFIFRKSPYFY